MSFFDAPWHWALLALAALLLFGSSRLPGAAKALGSSMNIFKRAMKEGAESEGGTTTQANVVAPPQPQITTAPATGTQQAQIDAMQRQLNDLHRQQAPADATPASEAQPHTQSY